MTSRNDYQQGLFRSIHDADLRFNPNFLANCEIETGQVKGSRSAATDNFQNNASLHASTSARPWWARWSGGRSSPTAPGNRSASATAPTSIAHGTACVSTRQATTIGDAAGGEQQRRRRTSGQMIGDLWHERQRRPLRAVAAGLGPLSDDHGRTRRERLVDVPQTLHLADQGRAAASNALGKWPRVAEGKKHA